MSEYDPQDWHDTSVPPPPRRAARRWRWLGVAALLTVAADQVTKIAVRASLEPGERVEVLPGIDLLRARNDGIAFGLFPGNRGVVVALTVVALGVIAFVLARLAVRSRAVAVGGGMLLGGAAGNLLDRVLRGGVTDFVDLPAWPAFNVADIAIVAGAVVIAIGLLRRAPDDE